MPGGSSGGSAAAVAAGEAIATLGSDTGGSIRQPAALCSVVGLKPTYGRVSRYGLIAFASSLDQIGPFARSVEDAATVLGAIAGHDPRDSTSVKPDVPDYGAGMARAARSRAASGSSASRRSTSARASTRRSARPSRPRSTSTGRWAARSRRCRCPHTKYAVGAYYIIATAECSSNLARYDGVRYGHRSKDAKDALDLYFKSRAEGFGRR